MGESSSLAREETAVVPQLEVITMTTGARAVRASLHTAEVVTVPPPPARFVHEEDEQSPYFTDVLAVGEQAIWVDAARGWLFCSDSFIVHPNRRHEGSDASYFVDGYILGDDAVFVYWLVGSTSHHHHSHPDLSAEHYYLLFGEAYITGEPMGAFHEAGHRGDHQVVSETGALVVAVLKGAAQVPRDQWHTRF